MEDTAFPITKQLAIKQKGFIQFYNKCLSDSHKELEFVVFTTTKGWTTKVKQWAGVIGISA